MIDALIILYALLMVKKDLLTCPLVGFLPRFLIVVVCCWAGREGRFRGEEKGEVEARASPERPSESSGLLKLGCKVMFEE